MANTIFEERLSREIEVVRHMDIEQYRLEELRERNERIFLGWLRDFKGRLRGANVAEKYEELKNKNERRMAKRIRALKRRIDPDDHSYASVVAIDTGALIDLQNQLGTQRCLDYLVRLNDESLPIITKGVAEEIKQHATHVFINRRPEINRLIYSQMQLLRDCYSRWLSNCHDNGDIDRQRINWKIYWASKLIGQEKEEEPSEADKELIREAIIASQLKTCKSLKKERGIKAIVGSIVLTSDSHLELLREYLGELPYRIPPNLSENEDFDKIDPNNGNYKNVHVINTRKLMQNGRTY